MSGVAALGVPSLRLEVRLFGGLDWRFFRALGSALNDFLFVECGATGVLLRR